MDQVWMDQERWTKKDGGSSLDGNVWMDQVWKKTWICGWIKIGFKVFYIPKKGPRGATKLRLKFK